MNIDEFKNLFPSVKDLYYSEVFNEKNESFCSFMKEIKADASKFNKQASVLAEKIKSSAGNIDIFVSVPKFGGEANEPDYSKILAEKLSDKLNIPYRTNAVTKVKKTKKLKMLAYEERLKEIDDAFKVCLTQNLHICIVDDVLSSGATLREIIKTFMNAGINKISIAVMIIQAQ
ncbi:MAG: phosphoribosyltransferase [Endomicrobiaceae bacterium]|jgi:predicted amidophosphoribosyltransferase|nr:phosphoribosyltransferase [Endomicrobiaceae bacterium]